MSQEPYPLKATCVSNHSDHSEVHSAPTALDEALSQLVHGDFQQRWQVAKRLPELGDAAIAPLIALMQDETEDDDLRWFAARTLGQFRDSAALTALLSLLARTEDPELLAATTTALSQFGEASIEALTQLMARPGQRLLAVQTLAGIHHPATVPPLLSVVNDEDAAVRAAAIAALGNLRAEAAVSALLQARQDPAAAVRQAAVTALGRRPELLATRNLVDDLLPCLWDESLAVSQATARALGRLGSETAIAALGKVMQSPYTPEPLQLTVVRSLSWQPRESTLTVLLSVQPSAPQAVQLEVIAVLGRLQSPVLRQRAGNALCAWLRSRLGDAEAADLKQAIALALGQLQNIPARPLLQHLATDPDERVQVYAAAALRQLAA